MRLALAVLLALAAPAVAPAASKVGVTTLSLAKTSVTDGSTRTLDPVVWYPTATRHASPYADAVPDAPVRRGRHPLLVFSHGACGRPTEATYYTTALAARGFVVVAPRHPGDTADDFPACATLQTTVDSAVNRVPDVQATIDLLVAASNDKTSRFAHRLRPDVIGMTGLSFGGFTTLLAAQRDPRIIAALSMVPGGTAALDANDITIPTMVIGAERDKVVGFAESPKAYARLAGPRFLVELLGANHLSVVDDCFNHDLNANFCVPADISQDAAHALVLHYAVPFFRRYLLNVRSAGRTLVHPIDGVELTTEPVR